MRPRRLRVKGYTAFVEEAEVDFDGLDLFAITGPTGAGKTSLLQAMTIALYGRAPKLGDDLRQLISPLAEQARFHFEFQTHNRCYRITRVMSRNPPAARRSSAACCYARSAATPIRLAAVRCGTWLTTETISS